MDILRMAADPLEAALPAIGQRSFPGMSADDVDAFKLGFYAGAMAHALITRDNVQSADLIAERIEAELRRIESDGDEES